MNNFEKRKFLDYLEKLLPVADTNSYSFGTVFDFFMIDSEIAGCPAFSNSFSEKLTLTVLLYHKNTNKSRYFRVFKNTRAKNIISTKYVLKQK